MENVKCVKKTKDKNGEDVFDLVVLFDYVSEVKYKHYFDRSEFFKPELTTNIKEYWMDHMPEKIICCKRNRT